MKGVGENGALGEGCGLGRGERLAIGGLDMSRVRQERYGEDVGDKAGDGGNVRGLLGCGWRSRRK